MQLVYEEGINVEHLYNSYVEMYVFLSTVLSNAVGHSLYLVADMMFQVYVKM